VIDCNIDRDHDVYKNKTLFIFIL